MGRNNTLGFRYFNYMILELIKVLMDIIRTRHGRPKGTHQLRPTLKMNEKTTNPS
ncbi:uncharacterized protein G2W53_019940 [Senna tora]|uniref:Uncharacterized protein n=1 Tax=Senna tora TaxID=362788 RepID=A0A834TYV8_9FABA|nr:uncharacterized protein G2W53_019940 [Senna tora]